MPAAGIERGKSLGLNIMNEKELIVKLIHTDEDAHYIFNVFKDNHRKGKIAFKKMRARNLLSSKAQIDELSASTKELTEVRELDLLLQEFTKPLTLTHLQQFLLIRELFPQFIADNLTVISHNIDAKNAPFSGLTAHRTEEEARDFYLYKYEELNLGLLEKCWQETVQMFERDLEGLETFRDAMTGMSLLELDRVLGTVGNGSGLEVDVRQAFFKEHLAKPLDSESLQMEKGCQKELTRLGILGAFLEVGDYPLEVRSKLLNELQRAHYAFKIQQMYLASIFAQLDLKKEADAAHQKYQAAQKELKALYQKNQELEQAKEKEKLMEEIRKLQETVQKQDRDLSQYAKVQEAGQEELDKIARLSQREMAHLKSRLQTYENLANGYKWLLARDFSTYELVVVYNSPLLYAKHIYHELTFMDIGTALSEPFKARKLLVQLIGMSGKQKKQIEKIASQSNMEIVMLESVDERDLIMDIACYLKESEGLIHESA